MVSGERPVILAATALEANAVRRAAPHAQLIECGIACARCEPSSLGTIVVSCGLAGGLRDDLATGTVIVADRVRRLDGSDLICDRALVLQLAVAARKAGYEPLVAPIVTTDAVVARALRREWAERGYAAADMESGRIVAPRVAAVRVVLDTPSREISPAWATPLRAFLNPLLWGQALWLAREGPRCARIAAAVVARAFG